MYLDGLPWAHPTAPASHWPLFCPIEEEKNRHSGRLDLNPGPLKATLLANSVTFNRKKLSPHNPESSSLRLSGITSFVGDWWRNANYERRGIIGLDRIFAWELSLSFGVVLHFKTFLLKQLLFCTNFPFRWIDLPRIQSTYKVFF